MLESAWRISAGISASFVLGFSSYSSLFFISLFLQYGQGEAPASTGWRMMPQFLMMGIVSLSFGQIAARIRIHTLMMAGYGMVGAALLMMGYFQVDTAGSTIAAVFALMGMGMGLAVPAMGLTIMGIVPSECAGIASATLNALRQTGMSLGNYFPIKGCRDRSRMQVVILQDSRGALCLHRARVAAYKVIRYTNDRSFI